MPRKGITVSIYSRRGWSGDYSNRVSNRSNTFVLTGPNIPEDTEPHDEAPELRLEQRGGIWIAIPTEELTDPKHTWEFGGTFVFSDRNFPHDYPIPIYDQESSPATVSMDF